MYAIVKTGGKQYKVAEGEVLEVEKLNGESGDEVIFDQVLMVKNDDDVKIGRPLVENAKVTAKIVAQTKGKKIIVLHKRRRKSSSKKTGHRQPYTKLEITGIEG